MHLFLYDLPNWAMFFVVTGFVTSVAVGGFYVFRRFVNVEIPEAERGLALTVLGIISTVNSLLLAFSAVSVWESFGGADEAVVGEANTAAELARDLSSFGSQESAKARTELREYVTMVVEKEWPLMAEGKTFEPAWAKLDEMFREVALLEPNTPRKAALMPEIWARTNEMVKHRRERAYAAESAVPSMLWTVVLIGTLGSIFLMYVLPKSRFNALMIGVVAFSFGLVFYFIIAMDHPFLGNEAVAAEPFESTLAGMARWDTEPEIGAPSVGH